jgi:hypothetical protein
MNSIMNPSTVRTTDADLACRLNQRDDPTEELVRTTLDKETNNDYSLT